MIRSEVGSMIDGMMASSLHPFRGKLEQLATYYESILEKEHAARVIATSRVDELEMERNKLRDYVKELTAEKEQEDLQSAITQLASRVKKLEEWVSS